MGYHFPDCFCGQNRYSRVFLYDQAPEGETRFDFDYERYRREVKRCEICGHYVSVHDLEMRQMYEGEYVDSTYTDDNGMRRNFERIVALPPEESDNTGRVERVVAFAESHFDKDKLRQQPSVLDVGSGLCVFLYKMKARGFACTALDVDERLVKAAKELAGVDAVRADFMNTDLLSRFDMITFNKVLEHVKNPVATLAKCREYLNPDGFVYIELPDGEAAVREGSGREEFFIEHWHVFSAASTALMVQQSGFRIESLERLREPSNKFTIRAFLVMANQSNIDNNFY
jgi:2-polyprenyl-3-methyl-5-hydroxy-6-metoxy-1,4-benzoquinol methylase